MEARDPAVAKPQSGVRGVMLRWLEGVVRGWKYPWKRSGEKIGRGTMGHNYHVIFLNLTESPETFCRRMFRLGVAESLTQRIIAEAPVVLKGGMDREEALRYAEAVRRAGGRVRVQKDDAPGKWTLIEGGRGIEPFESFTMCPQCGYKQHKARTCVRCGFDLTPGAVHRSFME